MAPVWERWPSRAIRNCRLEVNTSDLGAGISEVLLGGERCQLLGRPCMGSCRTLGCHGAMRSWKGAPCDACRTNYLVRICQSPYDFLHCMTNSVYVSNVIESNPTQLNLLLCIWSYVSTNTRPDGRPTASVRDWASPNTTGRPTATEARCIVPLLICGPVRLQLSASNGNVLVKEARWWSLDALAGIEHHMWSNVADSDELRVSNLGAKNSKTYPWSKHLSVWHTQTQ